MCLLWLTAVGLQLHCVNESWMERALNEQKVQTTDLQKTPDYFPKRDH